MASWPSSLPTNVIAGSHQMHPQPNVVAFNPDVGEPILRRRYTGRSSLENFDLILTKAQTDRLFEFWDTDCAQGALTFWARLVDGVQRKWWFDPDTPPSATNIRGGTAYRVSITVGCRR